MAKAYKLVTTVLPGHRIEVTAPEVEVGRKVELIVREQVQDSEGRMSILDYLESLPPRSHTPEEWAEIERQFQEERDSWDR